MPKKKVLSMTELAAELAGRKEVARFNLKLEIEKTIKTVRKNHYPKYNISKDDISSVLSSILYAMTN